MCVCFKKMKDNFFTILVLILTIMNCTLCAKSTKDFDGLLRHLRSTHIHENNFIVQCNFNNCCQSFKNISSLKSHVHRKHYLQLLSIKTQSERVLRCPSCNINVKSLKELSTHYRSHCENGCIVQCVVPNCGKSFSVYSSYTSHITRKHNNFTLDIDRMCEPTEPCPSSSSHNVLTDEVNNIEIPNVDFDDFDSSNVKRNTALLQLKIQEKYLVPQSTVQKISQDYKELFELGIEKIIFEINAAKLKDNLDAKTVNSILSIIENNCVTKSLGELGTIKKRLSFYKEQFNFVEPISITLGVGKNNKPCTYHYVPILDTLRFLLSQNIVFEEVVNNYDNANPTIYTDFKDGLYAQNNPLFSQSPQALKIYLYCDEFEICNPIGVHRKMHKLFAFYYILGNIQPKYRSCIDSIQLVLLCKNIYVRKFGLDLVVKPLIQDLEELRETGVSVSGIVFKGGLAYLSADNLASHFVGGFLECFSPKVNRLCRTCLCDKNEMRTAFSDDNVTLRTKENYDEHVALNQDLRSNFGVKFKSPMNHSNFHVVEGLPPDIAHDLLEGVAPYEIGLVLQQLVTGEKLFTLEYLNTKIELFPYGPLDIIDKPCTVPMSFKLSQTAARMWCLLRLLPLMLCEVVPNDNIFWKLILDIKSIVEIVFAQEINMDYIAFLKMKVEDHLQMFKDIFPGKRMKPKQHFLIHYARHMLNYGPLRKCWTLRYEAKHFYFKRLATAGKNFKDVSKTLATRHQLFQAYCAGSGNYLKNTLIFGFLKQVSINSIPEKVRLFPEANGWVQNQMLNTYKSVSLNSLKYSIGLYVVIDFRHDQPCFGCIEYILPSRGDEVFFIVKHVESTYYEHAGAYSVRNIKDWSVVNLNDLLDVYPLSSYFVGRNHFVVLKNIIIGK